ncbi:MAG: hypothetical protein SGCHY_002135 [Lobulomycetales sp.]
MSFRPGSQQPPQGMPQQQRPTGYQQMGQQQQRPQHFPQQQQQQGVRPQQLQQMRPMGPQQLQRPQAPLQTQAPGAVPQFSNQNLQRQGPTANGSAGLVPSFVPQQRPMHQPMHQQHPRPQQHQYQQQQQPIPPQQPLPPQQLANQQQLQQQPLPPVPQARSAINKNSVSGHPASNCHENYKTCTLTSVPNTSQLLEKSRLDPFIADIFRLPFGLVISPYRSTLPGEEEVPVINPLAIVRCRKCRTYINPWVQFVDQGTRWKCNLCYLSNEVPSFFDWDPKTNEQLDRFARPELCHSVVEFIAPQEYMVRPPQPVVILFLIDVSHSAVSSGMVAVAARTILDSLDDIPDTEGRTKIAFVTCDSAIHFYNFNSGLSEPQMLVVADLDGEPYLPCPDDLLVSLSESRSVIEAFLERLGDMFRPTQNPANCLGRALQFSFKLLHAIGGKIVVLQSALPNNHDGSLKNRGLEEANLLGTSKETSLLLPSSQFYKSLAVDCSRAQVCIDMFMFNGQYADVATLSGCAKYTGGSVYYYPQFSADRDADVQKFSSELSHFLGRGIGLEAVLRVRATRGISMSNYHGNFFLRSTDLLQLPNVNPDNSFCIEMTIDETLSGSIACFQTALLHTSSSGERRIRVITLALPIVSTIDAVFSGSHGRAISTLLTKKAIERAFTSARLEDAREALLHKLVDIMTSFKATCTTNAQSAALLVPETLRMLPALTLGLLKSMAFRDTKTVPSDARSYILSCYYVTGLAMNTIEVYPRFWALHAIPDPELPSKGNDERLPGLLERTPLLNPASERIERGAMYLLDNGHDLFLWIGKGVDPSALRDLFDRSYDALPSGKFCLSARENAFSARVTGLIEEIRETRMIESTIHQQLYLVKEDGDSRLRAWFLSFLAEDRQSETLMSYISFLQYLKESLASTVAGRS